jgi:hypothetical protein
MTADGRRGVDLLSLVLAALVAPPATAAGFAAYLGLFADASPDGQPFLVGLAILLSVPLGMLGAGLVLWPCLALAERAPARRRAPACVAAGAAAGVLHLALAALTVGLGDAGADLPALILGGLTGVGLTALLLIQHDATALAAAAVAPLLAGALAGGVYVLTRGWGTLRS